MIRFYLEVLRRFHSEPHVNRRCGIPAPRQPTRLDAWFWQRTCWPPTHLGTVPKSPTTNQINLTLVWGLGPRGVGNLRGGQDPGIKSLCSDPRLSPPVNHFPSRTTLHSKTLFPEMNKRYSSEIILFLINTIFPTMTHMSFSFFFLYDH